MKKRKTETKKLDKNKVTNVNVNMGIQFDKE